MSSGVEPYLNLDNKAGHQTKPWGDQESNQHSGRMLEVLCRGERTGTMNTCQNNIPTMEVL